MMQTRQDITTPLTVDAWNSCYEALSLELSNKKESLAQEQQKQLESIKSGIEERLRKESQATVIHGHAFTPEIEALQTLYDALIKQTDPVELKGLSHIIQTFLQNNPRMLKSINPDDINNGTFMIPFGVTSIGEGAFRDCTALKSITIPTSVTSIGDGAFYNCTTLVSITIPASVTSIGPTTFSGCAALASITIPASVTSIGNGAFSGCTALASITIPASVAWIGNGAFYDCTSLASIRIPASVTSIGTATFSGCAALASIAIPASVTSIGGLAFNGCTALASIRIPASVTSIGTATFSGCAALASITIPDSVISIGWYAFDKCRSLTTVMIDARTPESYEKVLKRLPENLQEKAKRVERSDFKAKFVTTVVNEGYQHGFFGGYRVPVEVTKTILSSLGQTCGLPPINEQAMTLSIKEKKQPLSSQKKKRQGDHDEDSIINKRRRLNDQKDVLKTLDMDEQVEDILKLC